ncbi:hemolysin family protein [Oleidesulfovibrio sp.]|uniref:hemolysin family protein n=1 Tax=Oleidesulfovibrio sp. TaxID=2909707 RepID=UPI003A85F355
MDIVLLLFLIILNGIFAMSELALVTAKKSRLQRLADEGDNAARTAIRLGEEPTQFLSTVQIGITAIGVLSGIVGEAALAGPLAEFFVSAGLSPRHSSIAATTIVVAGVTFFAIVIGELVPKRLAQFNAEGIARTMARPIALLATLSRPFVFLLSFSTDAILRLLGKKNSDSADLTEDDIYAVLVEGSIAGVLEEQEHEMMRKVFRLDDNQVVSLMTPRSEIVFLDVEDTNEENLARLVDSGHSRLPVCRESISDVLGIISAKRILKQHLKGEPLSLESDLKPAVYVPESMSCLKLLDQFRSSDIQMVFVVDEYGEVLGIVTLQDVLEALTGEFMPQNPDEAWAFMREDGSWLLDGLIPVHELKDRLELRTVPEQEKRQYNTLGGMLMWISGNIPRTGDTAEWEGWKFEVVNITKNRIDKVLATRLPETANGDVPE